VTIFALLLTLVLIFAFQAENLTTRWFAVVLIAVPILILEALERISGSAGPHRHHCLRQRGPGVPDFPRPGKSPSLAV
jgi:hypothetical protein